MSILWVYSKKMRMIKKFNKRKWIKKSSRKLQRMLRKRPWKLH